MWPSRTLFSSVTLVLLVAISSWFAIKYSQIKQPKASEVKTASTVLDDITVWQMTVTGELDYIAQATKGIQYGDQRVWLKPIKVDFYHQQQPPWLGSADYAWVSSNYQKIELFDHVTLRRAAHANHPPLLFGTSELTIYPQRDYIDTNKAVSLREPGTGNMTTAIGLTGYPKKQLFHLLHEVRSTYVPAS